MAEDSICTISLAKEREPVYVEAYGSFAKVDFPESVSYSDVPLFNDAIHEAAPRAKIFFAENNWSCHILPLVWDGVSPVLHFDAHPDTTFDTYYDGAIMSSNSQNINYYNHVNYVAERADVYWILGIGGRTNVIESHPVGMAPNGRPLIKMSSNEFSHPHIANLYLKDRLNGPAHLHMDPDDFSEGPENDWGHGEISLLDFRMILGDIPLTQVSASFSDRDYLKKTVSYCHVLK